MNRYYSNLIEGHHTHPVEIERALKNDYSKDPRKRDLQLETKALITVQKWIDGGGLKGRASRSEGIREIHRRFGDLLPEDLLWVEDLDTKERVRLASELRKRDVKVGTHTAISPRCVATFSESLRGSLQSPEANGLHSWCSDSASPPFVDSPVP